MSEDKNAALIKETALSFQNNIPFLRYFFFRKTIAEYQSLNLFKYPIIEILSIILSVVSVFVFGFTLNVLFVIPLCSILVSLSVIDHKMFLLPDNLTLFLIWIGLIANYFSVMTDLNSAFLGAVFGYLSLWVFAHIYSFLTTTESIGYGDFKLFAALGAWFGYQALPCIILLATLFALLAALTSKDKCISFGPSLAIAGITFLFGHDYLSHLTFSGVF